MDKLSRKCLQYPPNELLFSALDHAITVHNCYTTAPSWFALLQLLLIARLFVSSGCCVNAMITPIRLIDQVDYSANYVNKATSTTIILLYCNYYSPCSGDGSVVELFWISHANNYFAQCYDCEIWVSQLVLRPYWHKNI